MLPNYILFSVSYLFHIAPSAWDVVYLCAPFPTLTETEATWGGSLYWGVLKGATNYQPWVRFTNALHVTKSHDLQSCTWACQLLKSVSIIMTLSARLPPYALIQHTRNDLYLYAFLITIDKLHFPVRKLTEAKYHVLIGSWHNGRFISKWTDCACV